ncbi:hypothetical protein Lbir_2076 [Legionella birminghamensis]|uniref:Alpha/beta hydrolase n=1 Tax=Legionella birminghamensis TaxID=28083 RepID=A0A378IA12_9GAMM|nr:hypothetical protein [Legionella birminghamensis]KTC69337.1 hypothetical protein Lbir_2076 [Legionella birminghamensis]STX31600.1 alpha/beta hydrolase [Legionella birminghamensis]
MILYGYGNYKLQAVPHVWRDTVGPLNSIMLGTAEMLRGAANTRAAALEEYKQLVNSISSSDPSDWYYIFNSSYDYDPAPGLSKIKAQVLAINFKDDLINPLEFIHIPETGNMHHAVLPGGFGHLSFAHANLWINPVNHFLGNLPEWDKF